MALARVLCPTLIGRETELSALEDALLAALRGDGGGVLVGGGAGAGKTPRGAAPATPGLLHYVTRRLRPTNVLVLATYRMDEMHRKHPLVPTIQGWRRTGQAQFIELQSLPPAAVADMVCAIFEERQVSDEFRDFF